MEPERALPALQARDFDLVLAEEHPGGPNPRPAELEQARHRTMSPCRDAGFESDVRFETADLLLHQRLVEQRRAFLPGLVWSGQPPTVALRPLPRGRSTRRVATVVRRGGGRHPAVQACRSALQEAVALHAVKDASHEAG
ncbi:hypothetical protein [Streptomyces sp. NPDC094149]|uniref:hypothetical protein n=1 Tax=Streptomyces sp. NPDC094149 TaxID=3155079 RepID=UPI00332163B2